MGFKRPLVRLQSLGPLLGSQKCRFYPTFESFFFCESKLFHYFFIVSGRFFTIIHFLSRLITFISLLIQQIAHYITAKRGGLFKLMSVNR